MFLREPSHILILLIVVLVLFGAKRLPDSARSLGRSMRIFKSEMKEMTTEEKKAVLQERLISWLCRQERRGP